MPTYQYACTSNGCGNEFELVQSFSDPAADECPTCGGPVRKKFSAVGVVFKGSGFYRTDSRKSSSSGDAAATKPKETSSSTSESSAPAAASSAGGSAGSKAAASA